MKLGADFKKLVLIMVWGCLAVPVDSAAVFSDHWIISLLTFAILILMSIEREFSWGEVLAAVLVSVSLYMPAGNSAAMVACPWLIVRAWDGFRALGAIDNLCLAGSRVFPAIGAAWLAAHRANWTPFGFDPLIILLTAAHFHHAGFTLPLMAGLNAKANPGFLTKGSCVAILAGVPLVAVGITCTHFGVLWFVEPLGVTVLVLGALGVAVSQILRGLEKERSGLLRTGFIISGASLLSAMILAMGFGLRHVVPNRALRCRRCG